MKARVWTFALACLWAAGALAAPSFTVSSYQLVSQRRLNLTSYEYVYRATVRNTGTAATVVAARLLTLPGSLIAVDDNLAFGDLAAGATRQSTDTFTVRHNRTAGAFNAASLAWQFTFSDPDRGLLAGAANAPAIAALQSFQDPAVDYTADQLSTYPNGSKVLRTSLLLVLDSTATVGEINAVLQQHGARITTMVPGIDELAVRIPDPGSLGALQALMTTLEAMPGIARVEPADLPRGEALPPNPPFQRNPPELLDTIGHQLALRGNGVWNLRARLNDAVTTGQMPRLVIVDYFGEGPPTEARGFDVIATASDYSTRVNHIDEKGHGYKVLSMIAASFGGNDNDLGRATGLVPVRIQVKAYDLQRVPLPDLQLQLAEYLRANARANGRRIVLNLSIGSDAPCRRELGVIVIGNVAVQVPNFVCDGPTPDELVQNRLHGQDWLRKLRGRYFFAADAIDASPEPYFLQVSAAGNNYKYPALEASGYNYAAEPLLSLIDDDGNPVFTSPGLPLTFPGLSNALRVEGRYGVVGNATVKPAPGCVDSNTNPFDAAWREFSPGGDISAIGNMRNLELGGRITGIFAPQGLDGEIFTNGSSFATPQVAAAAMLVWAMNPPLRSSVVKNILTRTSGGLNSPECITEGDYEFPLDAYGALLAADHPAFAGGLGTNATRQTAPVRLALLDVAGSNAGSLVYDPDGRFTQADLLAFVREFQQRHGSRLDYSRFDLNGDGRSGEPTVVRQPTTVETADTALGAQRFDLDGDGRIATATQTIEGLPIVFEENDIDDISILVYYAYSPLYEGNEYERTLILLPHLEFSNESALLKPFLRSLTMSLSGLDPSLSGTTTLGSIFYQASSSDTGDEFGTRFVSQCAAELGTPAFSADVDAAAINLPDGADVASPTWWWATATSNTPPVGQNFGTRCSDFIAAVPGTGELWVNITKFRLLEPSREYQTRLWFGRPDLDAGPAGTSAAPRFEPPPFRLMTQRGRFGFVETSGTGAFVAGPPSAGFRLLKVGVQPSATYTHQVRNPAPGAPAATAAARSALVTTVPGAIPRPVTRKRKLARLSNR